MKAKIRVVIIGIIMAGLAGMYSMIDKSRAVYDTDIDVSQFQGIFLEEGKEVVQEFVCEEESLDAVGFKVAVDNQMDKKKILLSYRLIEQGSGKQMAEGETNLEGMKVGKFFQAHFPKIKGCHGKAYRFSISLKQRGTDGNIQLFYVPGRSEEAKLFYGDEQIEGVGLFRTVTHRFDLETFIVAASFLIYIVVFMRWIYKLFK